MPPAVTGIHTRIWCTVAAAYVLHMLLRLSTLLIQLSQQCPGGYQSRLLTLYQWHATEPQRCLPRWSCCSVSYM